MFKIIEANPTKYTNEYKLSISRILEKVKHNLIDSYPDETGKLEYDDTVQKLNVQKLISFHFVDMDLEDEESI